ncbi:ATP-binding cassette domain-containing protein [bacterium]|jgi:cell division transport system ATP-binding protein|nr:ATP-binding cassette domain-containing protein [bacterium]
MIELRQVAKVYPPQQTALNGVSLTIQPGEFTCIAGASGAGKSTLLRILFGAEVPTGGNARVVGRDMAHLPHQQLPSFRRDVGFVFQDYKLLPTRTVLENVTFPLEVQGYSEQVRSSMGLRMLETVGLVGEAHRLPESLSGGEQQRVAVLRALIHRPHLILADEPTGNLDPGMTATVFRLLEEANRQGITIVVASHDLALIEQMGFRTIVLDRGKVVGDFARREKRL